MKSELIPTKVKFRGWKLNQLPLRAVELEIKDVKSIEGGCWPGGTVTGPFCWGHQCCHGCRWQGECTAGHSIFLGGCNYPNGCNA